MGRVTVVGSYIEALVMDVDRIPIAGETMNGRNYHRTFGGKGSNVAVCAARLGADTSFIGKIGSDLAGREFLALLQREQVRSRGILHSSQLPTGVGFIIFSRDGNNLIVIDTGANGELSTSDIQTQSEIIRNSDAVVSQLEIPIASALTAASIAASHGVKTILNPAPAIDLRRHDLTHVFALTPNETEARICLGLPADAVASDHDLAKAFLDRGIENVMLTRGPRGVVWASRQGIHSIPALEVNAIDTVGAGDAFNAGLAVGISENLPIPEAIAFGVAAASLSTEVRETIQSYPYRSQVLPRTKEILEKIVRVDC